jgi:hypothetical protein
MTSSRDYYINHHKAVLRPDGSYSNKHDHILWFNEEGQRHRSDGPAHIFTNGYPFWWINGIQYTFEEWCSKLSKSSKEIVLLEVRYA